MLQEKVLPREERSSCDHCLKYRHQFFNSTWQETSIMEEIQWGYFTHPSLIQEKWQSPVAENVLRKCAFFINILPLANMNQSGLSYMSIAQLRALLIHYTTVESLVNFCNLSAEGCWPQPIAGYHRLSHILLTSMALIQKNLFNLKAIEETATWPTAVP